MCVFNFVALYCFNFKQIDYISVSSYHVNNGIDKTMDKVIDKTIDKVIDKTIDKVIDKM